MYVAADRLARCVLALLLTLTSAEVCICRNLDLKLSDAKSSAGRFYKSGITERRSALNGEAGIYFGSVLIASQRGVFCSICGWPRAPRRFDVSALSSTCRFEVWCEVADYHCVALCVIVKHKKGSAATVLHSAFVVSGPRPYRRWCWRAVVEAAPGFTCTIIWSSSQSIDLSTSVNTQHHLYIVSLATWLIRTHHEHVTMTTLLKVLVHPG